MKRVGPEFDALIESLRKANGKPRRPQSYTKTTDQLAQLIRKRQIDIEIITGGKR